MRNSLEVADLLKVLLAQVRSETPYITGDPQAILVWWEKEIPTLPPYWNERLNTSAVHLDLLQALERFQDEDGILRALAKHPGIWRITLEVDVAITMVAEFQESNHVLGQHLKGLCNSFAKRFGVQ